MKTTSIIAAVLLSALSLPVFAQTGTTAPAATSPASASSATKTAPAAKHKTVKHTVKKDKTSTAPATMPATAK